MKIDRENGYVFIDGVQRQICDICVHKDKMTRDLDGRICAECGSDNGFEKYIYNSDWVLQEIR